MGDSPGAARSGGARRALADERVDLIRFTDGDAPRSLVVAPVTPETQRSGIAGEIFVVSVRGAAWPVNEVLRISGPLDELVRERAPRAP